MQSPMDIHPVDEPKALALVSSLEAKLHRFAFGERGITADFQLPTEQLCFELPRDLQPLMDDSILSVLTKRFSLAPDEHLFGLAMTTGKTVLAIYLCIYPPHFPQIGTRINYAVSSAKLNRLPRFPCPRNGEGRVEQVSKGYGDDDARRSRNRQNLPHDLAADTRRVRMGRG